VSQQLLDRLGRPYTSMMLPGLRIGKPPPNKGETYEPELYTRDEVKTLMRAMGRGLAGVRDRAILTVMYRAGGRVTETLKIRPQDVRVDRGEIYFRYGKGNKKVKYKPRTTPIDDEAMALIEKWIRVRAQLPELPPRAPLFCTFARGNVGSGVQASCFREKLHRVERRIAFPKRVNPHSFRHTAACDLLAEGYDLKQIQTFLGHENIQTTDRYLHVDYDQMRREIRGRSWSGAAPAPPVELADVVARLAELEQLLRAA
jgi:site-specific recombinase XerD